MLEWQKQRERKLAAQKAALEREEAAQHKAPEVAAGSQAILKAMGRSSTPSSGKGGKGASSGVGDRLHNMAKVYQQKQTKLAAKVSQEHTFKPKLSVHSAALKRSVRQDYHAHPYMTHCTIPYIHPFRTTVSFIS